MDDVAVFRGALVDVEVKGVRKGQVLDPRELRRVLVELQHERVELVCTELVVDGEVQRNLERCVVDRQLSRGVQR